MRVYTRPILILAVLALGASVPDTRAGDKNPKEVEVPAKVQKDHGEKAIAILSGATKVEAFRLDKKILAMPGKNTIGADTLQFAITATGKEKDEKFAAKVRVLLFDEATRTHSGAGGFRADVAFRLFKGDESVTVVVDFEGFQFLVVTRDAKGKQLGGAYGGFLFDKKGEFDKGGLFTTVKALALEAFPDDAELKALGKIEVDATDLLNPPVKK